MPAKISESVSASPQHVSSLVEKLDVFGLASRLEIDRLLQAFGPFYPAKIGGCNSQTPMIQPKLDARLSRHPKLPNFRNSSSYFPCILAFADLRYWKSSKWSVRLEYRPSTELCW